MTIQAGMSDETWIWLMDKGWRVVTHRPDRRQYRDIPASWVTRLIDADVSQRESVLIDAIANASSRSAHSSRASPNV